MTILNSWWMGNACTFIFAPSGSAGVAEVTHESEASVPEIKWLLAKEISRVCHLTSRTRKRRHRTTHSSISISWVFALFSSSWRLRLSEVDVPRTTYMLLGLGWGSWSLYTSSSNAGLRGRYVSCSARNNRYFSRKLTKFAKLSQAQHLQNNLQLN